MVIHLSLHLHLRYLPIIKWVFYILYALGCCVYIFPVEPRIQSPVFTLLAVGYTTAPILMRGNQVTVLVGLQSSHKRYWG
jgi:hypothetical protein